MKTFERIIGYFEPKITETVRDEAKSFIGKLMTFEALWLISDCDSEIYSGQWAMQPIDENGDRLNFGWVPSGDIRADVIAEDLR